MTKPRACHANPPVATEGPHRSSRGGWRWLARALLPLLALLSFTMPVHAAMEFERGINLSHWFEVEGSNLVDATQMKALRAAGFDHVRIPVDPVLMGWQPRVDSRSSDSSPAGPQTQGLKPTAVAALHTGVANAVAADLDVIVDMSPDAETKADIEATPAMAEAYQQMWETLTRALADLPSTRVAFELMNEPQYYGGSGARWLALQAQLAARLREEAPERTLILSGPLGGSAAGMTEITPLRDPNVIYTFHYYLPFLFTHQGANWMLDDTGTTAAFFRHVPYPSELAKVAPPRRLNTGYMPRANRELNSYVAEQWNRGRIAVELETARQWGERHGVRVMCTEFGVIRDNVEPTSRYRWMNDVRTTLEQMNIGWTVWDYDDAFGIAAPTRAGAVPQIDRAASIALGLPGSLP